MIEDKHGRRHLPGGVGNVVGSVIAVVFGIFWIGGASSMGAPAIFPLFGLVFIFAAIYGGIHSAHKASGYRSAHARYRARRRQLELQARRHRGH